MPHYHRRPRSHSVRRSWLDNFDFNPEIKRGVLAVFLFVLAGLSILSFLNLAGLAGSFWDALLSIAFGKTKYVLPLVLIIVGYLIEKEGEYDYRLTHFLGLVLFFLALNALFHLQFPQNELIAQATQGNGGGLLGVALAWPLKTYLDYWAALFILIALFTVSLLFLLNTSLARLIDAHRVFFAHLGWVGRSMLSLAHLVSPPPTQEDDAVAFERRPITAEEEETDVDYEETAEVEAGEEATEEESAEDAREPKTKPRMRTEFQLPPLSLLYTLKSKPTAGDIKANSAIIQETLANFGIPVDMGEIQVGPTVTQYAIKPDKGVKLNRITALHNDLALALAAHPIRIEAPIPGKSLVGIEVPNQRVAMVTLRELLDDPDAKGDSTLLQFGLGKDVAGKPQFAELIRMPHLLIAGATGSGKTVAINTLVASLLYQHTPETLRFIMVDPKRVELPVYNGIPHLLTPVITNNTTKTIHAIKWTIMEMERRFDLLSRAGVRDLGSYNKRADEPLPFIVFIIDELADLMITAGAEIEAGIVRLAQMSRAVGIHMVIATQRPSVDVITGLMKANIPARIAFSVASIVDSRTILDNAGAEKLLGRGDMLLLTAEMSKPKRIQGAYVSEEEVKRLVEFWKDQEAPQYEHDIAETGGPSLTAFSGGTPGERDSLFDEAERLVVESGKASASYLQRRLRVGYARAARLLDELEIAGVVGPADGAKPREILRSSIHDDTMDNEPVSDL